jgi:hypothetical protein
MATSAKTLESLINDWLNPRLGFPNGTKLWTRIDDRNVATIGMCYLYRCLGVWALHRMENEGGGVTVVLSASTSREFESMLRAFLKGLDYKN